MRLPPKFGEQRLIHLDHIAKTMQKSGFLLSPGVLVVCKCLSQSLLRLTAMMLNQNLNNIFATHQENTKLCNWTK